MRLAPVLVLLCLVCLNLMKGDPGRMWFSAGETVFAEPRGWPLAAVALANDEGATEVDASIVQGSTRVMRDVFDGPYPHLAWNTFCLVADLTVALVLVLGAWLLSRKIVASCSKGRVLAEYPQC